MYQHGTGPCRWCTSGTSWLLSYWFFLLSITLKRQPKSREYKIFLPFEEVGPFTWLINLTCLLLCLKDPPRGKEEWIPSDPRFTRAVDLVSYIRSVPDYSSWFCIGVAGNRFLLQTTIVIHLLFIGSSLSWRPCWYFSWRRPWYWQTQDESRCWCWLYYHPALLWCRSLSSLVQEGQAERWMWKIMCALIVSKIIIFS